MKASKIYSSIANIAPLYDFALFLSGYRGSVDRFVSKLPIDRNTPLRALDAGCGTGLYSLSVLEQFPNSRITAFDMNGKLVERLREKIVHKNIQQRAHLFTADIQGALSEIQNQKFDVIIAAGVLEYVPIESVVAHLSTLLDSGGYFLHSPVRDTLVGKCVGWLYACKPYSRARNIEAFTRNGLTLETLYVPVSFKELHIFKKH